MKRYKKSDAHSYSLGTTVTIELMRAKPEMLKKIYLHKKLEKNALYEEILDFCKARHIPAEESEKAFQILSSKENCFVIGEFAKYSCTLDFSRSHIVLDHPSNRGNLGTIIRTAVGFGIEDLAIIKPAVDVFDPAVIRASMGAVFRMRFHYYEDFASYFANAQNREIFLFMLDGESAVYELAAKEPYSLVFGNESSGLPADYKAFGQPVVIPHLGTIDSLNLDNAVSIGIYEMTKQTIKRQKE